MEIQLYHNDCFDIFPKIKAQSIDLIFTDLPFGTTQNKWDIPLPLEILWKHYERIIKDNGAILLFAQCPFDKILGASNLKLLRYEWIWEKEKGTGFLNANRMPLKSHENILVFYKKLPTYNPQFSEGKPYVKNKNPKKTTSNYGIFQTVDTHNQGYRYPKTLLRFASDSQKQNSLHPNQKPVALLEYLIKTYTNENETVLDNTMGSGSTGLACINTNRNFIGIEKELQYFEIAQKRLLTQKKYELL